MKFNILLAIVCLAIGASVAWLAKSVPQKDTANIEVENKKSPPNTKTTSSESQKRETSERTIVETEDPPAITVIPSDGEGSEQAREMGNRMEQMFRKRQQAKLDARISKLVSQLNLTSDQEAALRKAASDRMESFGEMMKGNVDPSKIGEMMNSDVIDDALADILTPEQQEELDAVKEREIANKVEAQALRELAKLSNLDLTQEQKDAAYDILYKDAEASVGNETPATGIISMVTEGFGIELDADALGVATAFVPDTDDIVNGEVETNPQAMMAKAQENMNKRIDDKVEAMRPVLNDNQLDQYRKDLELKSGGLFGGILGGFGAWEATGSTGDGE